MANTVKKTIDKLKSIFAPPSKIVTYTSQIKRFDKLIYSAITQNNGIVVGSTPSIITTSTSTFNFDVTANWSLTTPAVVDEASFRTFLESGQDGDGNTNDQTDVVVTNFLLEGNRLRCNVSSNGNFLGLASLEVTNVNAIGNIIGITQIDLYDNQISNFDPILALPNSLQELYLGENQIVTFDPTIALPDSLQNLGLNINNIVTFNPSILLPDSLTGLNLSSNQIVTFNPSLPLPNLLEVLELGNNQMTTAGYTASEPWANAMSVIPARGVVYFGGNLNGISGTNLETILIAKGWSVNG